MYDCHYTKIDNPNLNLTVHKGKQLRDPSPTEGFIPVLNNENIKKCTENNQYSANDTTYSTPFVLNQVYYKDMVENMAAPNALESDIYLLYFVARKLSWSQ